MLDVKRLNIFREVVSQGSFSAAADALAYSQSAVSQAIQTLEGEAGVALIERSRGGVRPTAAGAALTGHIGGILAQLEAAEDEIAAIVAGRGGHLRTASFPTAGATLMPRAIAAFRGSHPGVEVSLAEGEPEEIAPRLRAGEFDLALLFEFEGVGEHLTTGLRRFELFDDPLHLALPADHRLAARERAPRLDDLREESWIRLRTAGLLRERRLPHRPGPGRGRGRRGADPTDGAVDRSRRHRGAAAGPFEPGPQSVRGNSPRRRSDRRRGDDARRAP
jgi:DNA-binding transcriptional LysR family regulator